MYIRDIQVVCIAKDSTKTTVFSTWDFKPF